MSIGNPNAAFGQTAYALPASGGYIEVVNASTSTIAVNDAVALTSTAQRQVIQTAAALQSRAIFGVADESIPAGESGRVCIEGFHLIKLATAISWTYGDALVTSSSVAGGVKTSTDLTLSGTHIGVAQTSTVDTTDTDTIMAYIHKF